MPSQPPNDPVRIFLAYAREDFDAVSAIYDRLAALGLKPWMEEQDLLPGEKREVYLEQAIKDSHFFLACLSAKSVEKRGYIQREFRQALDLWQEKLDRDIYLIPVLLDECPVPETFRVFKCANLYEKDGWSALLRAIRTGAEQQGLPVPKGLVDLPPVHDRRRTTAGTWWLLAGLAAIVVVAIAVIAYVAGVIPPRQPSLAFSPSPTVFWPTPMLATTSLTVTSPISMELVRVPAGEFLMGSDPAKDSVAFDDEEPQHRVTLAEFYIGKHEVTNAQYAAFVKATRHDAAGFWQNGVMPAGKGDYPVIGVSWYDGVAFTEWLSGETGMGFRLCTEAEWEKACRGASSRIHPWGDAFDANKANTYESGIGTITSVGKYSPPGDSPYGVSDMGGNALEWVADWYGGNYYASSPTENPQGPDSGGYRVLRDGFFGDNERFARCACRSYGHADEHEGPNGFRVCVSPGL